MFSCSLQIHSDATKIEDDDEISLATKVKRKTASSSSANFALVASSASLNDPNADLEQIIVKTEECPKTDTGQDEVTESGGVVSLNTF